VAGGADGDVVAATGSRSASYVVIDQTFQLERSCSGLPVGEPIGMGSDEPSTCPSGPKFGSFRAAVVVSVSR
jgi:hypothetical protein